MPNEQSATNELHAMGIVSAGFLMVHFGAVLTPYFIYQGALPSAFVSATTFLAGQYVTRQGKEMVTKSRAHSF